MSQTPVFGQQLVYVENQTCTLVGRCKGISCVTMWSLPLAHETLVSCTFLHPPLFTFLHLPPLSFTFLNIPAPSFTFLHLSASSFIILHLPEPSCTFLNNHTPSSTILHLPAPSCRDPLKFSPTEKRLVQLLPCTTSLKPDWIAIEPGPPCGVLQKLERKMYFSTSAMHLQAELAGWVMCTWHAGAAGGGAE